MDIFATHRPPLVKLTVDQYHRMQKQRILSAKTSIELLNGLLMLKDSRSREMAAREKHAVRPIEAPLLARIDVDQYRRMLEKGILLEGSPIELLDGVLILKDRSAAGENIMTVGNKHVNALNRLAKLAALIDNQGAYLTTQTPIQLSSQSEPEPDGAIIKGGIDDASDRKPGPRDVRCVFEIADSSLDYDRTVKLQIYASAGIPQYILINIPQHQIEVYEKPNKRAKTYIRSTVINAAGDVKIKMAGTREITVKAERLLPKT